MKINNRKIRVLGKGVTSFVSKDKFPNVILYDDSDFNLYDRNSDELTIISPGIPPYNQMISNSKNFISDYDLFEDIMPFSIWISGTNGKTTTTRMCQHLLEKYDSIYDGNIGVPLSHLDENKKIWILETSSFTLRYAHRAKPNIYILLPITEDRIAWYGSFEEYKKAKLKPLGLMSENDMAIIPNEFKDVETKASVITYNDSDDLCGFFNIDKSKIKFKEPSLLDSILSLCISKIIFDEINYDSINEFIIDKHKVEEFYDRKNRLWIDNNKATNVDATMKALTPYQKSNIHIILGGDNKGANLSPLPENIKNLDIIVYTIGTNANRISQYCKEFSINVFKCDFLNIAVQKVSENMNQNSIAILSPAAASLSQFKSYAHRGDEFRNKVHDLSLD